MSSSKPGPCGVTIWKPSLPLPPPSTRHWELRPLLASYTRVDTRTNRRVASTWPRCSGCLHSTPPNCPNCMTEPRTPLSWMPWICIRWECPPSSGCHGYRNYSRVLE
uniref:Uncharacterized protein n=1 Tax=Cacopsylla melanoneura TaxID=428564 RepID=A0A8D8TWN9_9HEMI